MPYIPRTERLAFDADTTILASKIDTAGHLAYTVYRLMGLVVKRWGGRFSDYASVIGAVVLTTLEFIRRAVWSYENGKRAENGDVEL